MCPISSSLGGAVPPIVLSHRLLHSADGEIFEGEIKRNSQLIQPSVRKSCVFHEDAILHVAVFFNYCNEV